MLKFFKVSFAVLTACLTIGSLSSFRNFEATHWYYDGPETSGFNNRDNWQPAPVDGVDCGDEEDIPCRTDNELTEQQLIDMLAANPGANLFNEVSKRAGQ